MEAPKVSVQTTRDICQDDGLRPDPPPHTQKVPSIQGSSGSSGQATGRGRQSRHKCGTTVHSASDGDAISLSCGQAEFSFLFCVWKAFAELNSRSRQGPAAAVRLTPIGLHSLPRPSDPLSDVHTVFI